MANKEEFNQMAVAKANAEAGQQLTNAWHARMRHLDEIAPKLGLAKDDDPKRGAVSPLGGKVW